MTITATAATTTTFTTAFFIARSSRTYIAIQIAARLLPLVACMKM